MRSVGGAESALTPLPSSAAGEVRGAGARRAGAVALRPVLQRRAARLLDQQCWMWGRDVIRPAGNLLLEYGFTRLRSPEESPSCTQYTLPMRIGADDTGVAELRIWGFGLFLGWPLANGAGEDGWTEYEGGLYLNRFECVPRAVERLPAFGRPGDLASLPRARACGLLPEALRSLARYEQWVLDRCGLAYRQQGLDARKKAGIPPETVPGCWEELAGAVVLRLGR